MMIAIAGKRGVGKTVASALILRALLRSGQRPLLAVDADPRPGLYRRLGMHKPRAVVGLRGELMAAESGSAPKQGLVEALLNQRVEEGEGIDLVALGRTWRADGDHLAGRMLRHALSKLSSNYRAVVVDEGEGVDRLSRRSLTVIDHLVIVADPSPGGVAAAIGIAGLSVRIPLRVQKTWLLVNHAGGAARGEPVGEFKRLPEGLLLLGEIPHDPLLTAWEADGKPVLGLPESSIAAVAFERVVRERILDRAGLDTRRILDP
jgi:CO dehydrogenase maturation factor